MRNRALPLATQRIEPLILSPLEAENYSLMRAIDAARKGDWFDAGFERECSNEVAKRISALDPSPHTFHVPAAIMATAKRDLTVASATGGGYLVGDVDVVGVLDALRPRLVTARMGAQHLAGLKANTTYARQAGTATVTWSPTESTQATETSDLTLGSIALTPRTVSAYIEMSRQLRLMAPDLAERMTRRELAAALAVAVDAAALAGSGASGAPLGLLNTPSIGTFTGGSLAYAGLLEAQTDVITANALTGTGEVSFACRPAVASLLANRQGFSTLVPMWTGPLSVGQLIGCPAFSSMNVPASTLIAGDWSQLLLAEWGIGLEIKVNPYANFQAGTNGYAAALTVDVAVLQASAFSVATGVS